MMKNRILSTGGSAAGAIAATALRGLELDENGNPPITIVDEASDFEKRMMAHLTFTPEGLPDRLCVDSKSPYYMGEATQRKIGVKFNGEVRPNDVQEYCVSEGWVVLQKRVKRGARWVWELTKHEGQVEVFHRHNPQQVAKTQTDAARISAAEAKRARKAAKLQGKAQ